MKLILQFLSEDNGNPSATRIAMLMILVFVLTPWCYISCAKMVLQPFPMDLVLLCLGGMGVKAWQKMFEKPANPVNPPPAMKPFLRIIYTDDGKKHWPAVVAHSVSGCARAHFFGDGTYDVAGAYRDAQEYCEMWNNKSDHKEHPRHD